MTATTDDAPGRPPASTDAVDAPRPYGGFERRGWAAPPLVSGDWRTLETAEAATLLVRLQALLPPSRAPFIAHWPMAVRVMRPRFYPGWLIVEVQAAHADDRVGLCNLLYGPHGVALLDGTSMPIHRLNERGGLALGDDTAVVADYLRFFCSVVHGDEGRFLVLDEEGTLAAVSGRDTIALEPAPTLWSPLEITAADQRFVARGTILYGTLVARAVFHVERSGSIEMVEDEPVGTLMYPAEEYRKPFRLAHRPGPGT
jgi:hypothetical protein